MKLNRGKCVNLTMNRGSSNIQFLDGATMKRESAPAYLGTILTDLANNGTEISNRVSKAIAIVNELGIFWNRGEHHHNMTTKGLRCNHQNPIIIRLRNNRTNTARATQHERFPDEKNQKNPSDSTY
jgi:hypothetical protein